MKQTPREPDHNPSEPRNLSGVQFRYVYPGAASATSKDSYNGGS
jgi:hypothetical protein